MKTWQGTSVFCRVRDSYKTTIKKRDFARLPLTEDNMHSGRTERKVED